MRRWANDSHGDHSLFEGSAVCWAETVVAGDDGVAAGLAQYQEVS